MNGRKGRAARAEFGVEHRTGLPGDFAARLGKMATKGKYAKRHVVVHTTASVSAGPMPAAIARAAATVTPKKTVRVVRTNVRQEPSFPEVTFEYVKYLRDIDASPRLIRQVERFAKAD